MVANDSRSMNPYEWRTTDINISWPSDSMKVDHVHVNVRIFV